MKPMDHASVDRMSSLRERAMICSALVRRWNVLIPFVPVMIGVLLALGTSALAQLNENCTVSVLNRTVQVKSDGTWVLPNIPEHYYR